MYDQHFRNLFHLKDCFINYIGMDLVHLDDLLQVSDYSETQTRYGKAQTTTSKAQQ